MRENFGGGGGECQEPAPGIFIFEMGFHTYIPNKRILG